jgi:hypothetical protein
MDRSVKDLVGWFQRNGVRLDETKTQDQGGGSLKVIYVSWRQCISLRGGSDDAVSGLLHSKVFKMERYISKSLNRTTLFEGAYYFDR